MNNEALDYPAVTESPAELGRDLASIVTAVRDGNKAVEAAVMPVIGRMLLSEGRSTTDALALAVLALMLARMEKDKVPLHHADGWVNTPHIIEGLILQLVGVLETLSGESRSEFMVKPITFN